MADDGTVTSSLRLDGEDTAPSAGVISQYVKDLSVENPNAPESFSWQDSPQLDIQFNIQARAIQGEVHEVELKVQINARSEAGVAYIVDLTYAGVIGMRNREEAQMHAFMTPDAPPSVCPCPAPTAANSGGAPANSDSPLANFGACPAATDTYPGLPEPREPPP
ncbi:hypothetical protein E4T56_gene17469 [Termitomyces sp. T112]|nr:hypothetical protein E4T56_gene17469 [Termitomyces sp. T112]